MKIKKTILEKTLLATLLASFAFSMAPANAGIFNKIKKAGDSVIDDAGDVIDDAGDLGNELVNETGNAIGDTASNAARTSVQQARNVTSNLSQVVVTGSGLLVDSAGNVINESDLRDFAQTLMKVDPITGLKQIAQPFESSMMFNVALRNGAWKNISDALKQETVFIGLASGASLVDIRDQLANFDNRVQTAFAGTSNFILDTAASAQLGKGLALVRGAFSQCAGSVRNIDDCFEDFINQFIQFYQYIRHYIAKVTELKSYAKGEKFEQILNKINAVEKKSVKYFLPILENSSDMLDFSTSNGSFAERTSVHEGFEKYASIDDIRNSLEVTDYSYRIDPQRACARVSLPIICDSFSDLSNVAINRFNFREAGISGSEAAKRKRLFNAMSVKSFGAGYKNTKNNDRSLNEEMAVIHYLNSELFEEVNWSRTQDQRIPYIVKSDVLGGAGGAFIATDSDAIILLNEDLFSDDINVEEGFGKEDVFHARKVALEELGHWLNWRRCQYSDDMNNCADEGDTFGDSGAKFANASLLEYNNLNDYITQLKTVSEGLWSQPTQFTLGNGELATYEGNASLTDIQTALAQIDAKVRFRMRTQMGTPGSDLGVGELGSSGIIEINFTPLKRITAGAIKKREKYGYHDPDKRLFLGNINITFAIENYLGASSPISNIFLLPKIYAELGVKSSIGITIPLLKERLSSNSLAHLNNKYRDNNIGLSYGVSPYGFSYLSLLSIGETTKVSLDVTSAIWWGISTKWLAKSNTVPFSVMMAGMTVSGGALGCSNGVAALTAVGAPISTQLKCALGAQLYTGTMLSTAGALTSKSSKDVGFGHSRGWVAGVRVKVANKTTGMAVETRFEALFSGWDLGRNSIENFGQRMVNSRAFRDSENDGSAIDGRQPDHSGATPQSISSAQQAPSLSFTQGELLLLAGESITTQDRKLYMQEDGNLVLYRMNNGHLGNTLWASNTQGANNKVRFQRDGNFVIYNANGRAKWATGTNPHGNTLVLQEDGNLVIYSKSGRALWSSQTFE